MPETPRVVMVTAAGDERWPLLDEVRSRAELTQASDPEALKAGLRGANVLLVADFRTALVREAWPDAARLRWIHTTSAGVDVLMFPELQASRVVVTNARGVFDRAAAEFVMGCVIAFAKDFLLNLADQRRRRWQYRETRPVAGQRLLVYGAGSIGRAIARLARAAGMVAVGIARHPRAGDRDFDAVLGDDELHGELGRADYVAIAAPLTDATFHRFDATALARMRDDAVLVNVGRGPIVDTSALVAALRAGAIRGAALDVFEQEPLPSDHPLWSFDNVMISAHQAGDFEGWREAVMRGFLENLDRWIAGKPLANVVDLAAAPAPREEIRGRANTR